MELYDVIIIGSGPAGLSAAIYAKRAGLSSIIIEKSGVSGGQIINTFEVDNYPGLKGISGFDLGMKLREHAEAMGASFIEAKAEKIEKHEIGYLVITEKETYHAKTLLLAMGANHALLEIPGEEELCGMGVSYCATCDGAFFKNKTVAVVGGGDVAAGDAVFLARACKKVYLIHRRDSLRAAKALQEKIEKLENVEIVWNSIVTQIKGKDQVESILISNKLDQSEQELAVNGVFVAVGIHPETELCVDLVECDEKGYIIASEDGKTSQPGIFAAGDIRTKTLRQVITAASDGANCITSVEQYLNENH